MVHRSLERSRAVSRLELPIGLMCVVVAPACFWSTVAFLICYLLESTSGPHWAVAVFVFTSAFLTWMSSMLRVRI